MLTFGDALKSFRRGVYVANGGYNCLVVCANGNHLNVAFDEAVHILEASSLKVERVNYAERTVTTERGGKLWFKVQDYNFDERIKGYEWPHIISMCQLGNKTEEVLRAFNRTSNPNVTVLFQQASL